MKKAILLFTVLFSSLLLGASSTPESEPDVNLKSSGTVVYLDDHTFYTVPPEDFDPLTASNEELKQYGIPERPNDEESLAFWESLFSNKPTYIAPVIEEVPDWHSSRLQLPSAQSDKEEADKAILNN